VNPRKQETRHFFQSKDWNVGLRGIALRQPTDGAAKQLSEFTNVGDRHFVLKMRK
jgi:hypothetical protein